MIPKPISTYQIHCSKCDLKTGINETTKHFTAQNIESGWAMPN